MYGSSSLDDAGHVAQVGLELDELVPDLGLLLGPEAARGQRALEQHPRVVVLVLQEHSSIETQQTFRQTFSADCSHL